jgi:hypothetical protein
MTRSNDWSTGVPFGLKTITPTCVVLVNVTVANAASELTIVRACALATGTQLLMVWLNCTWYCPTDPGKANFPAGPVAPAGPAAPAPRVPLRGV